MNYLRQQSGLWFPDKRLRRPVSHGFDRKRGFLPGFAPGAAGGGEEAYVANAVEFDGTNDSLTKTSAFTGQTNGKVGLISLWINFQSGPPFVSADPILTCDWRVDNADGGLDFNLQPEGGSGPYQVLLAGYNTANATVLQLRVDGDKVPGGSGWTFGVWRHLLLSWDLANTAGHFYVNDIDSLSASILTDDNVDYSSPDYWQIGRNDAGVILDAYIADFWFDQQYLDLSVTANRRKFIDANGKPVNLGTDGSGAGLGQPLVFLSGETANWHTNKGSGGGFTENGALTTAASSPSD